jgi:hypothetical protein
VSHKTCPDCTLTLPLTAFQSRARGGHYSYCKTCSAIRNLRSQERCKPARGRPSVWRLDCPLNLAARNWHRGETLTARAGHATAML